MVTSLSIRTRTLAYIIIAVSIALLVVSFHMLNHSQFQRELELKNRVDIHLISVASTLSNRIWQLDIAGIEKVVNGLSEDPDFAYVEVVDENNKVLIRKKGKFSREIVTARKQQLSFGKNSVNLGHVYLELSHERFLKNQKRLFLENLFLYFLTLAVTVIVILASFRRITLPLDKLTKTMKQLADENLNLKIPYLQRQDEIGQIAKAVEIFKLNAIDRESLRKEQQANEEKLQRQANFDSLTGLPNRLFIVDHLAYMISEGKKSHSSFALIFVDLDDFKNINDTLNHETGDKLLIDAAERLQGAVDEHGMIGRLGGDEFLIVLDHNHSESEVQDIADRIISCCRKSFMVGIHKLLVSASAGIVIYPDHGVSASELLRKADSAMYHAKSSGRNTYAFFTDDMGRAISRRHKLEQALHGAMKNRELEVMYQPLFEISTGKLMGTEALLRWRNRLLGQISPEEFIPIAEQTAVIVEMGEFVLQDALRNTVKWNKMLGYNIEASVNISPRQLQDPKFIDKIRNALDLYDFRAEDLSLELTEGVLVNGAPEILATMERIKELGVLMAMDDFGTGYSSLSYLRRFSFDILKIDRIFVDGMTKSTEDAELVQASIAMAHGLNLLVIAEGVESKEQLNLLNKMGCNIAQGYLLGLPMSREKLEKRAINSTLVQMKRSGELGRNDLSTGSGT